MVVACILRLDCRVEVGGQVSSVEGAIQAEKTASVKSLRPEQAQPDAGTKINKKLKRS